MKQIVYDCDNTFGVTDCDVDDGLALIYLLGCEDANLHGITTTYGNNRLEVVLETTRRMLKELGREDIPVKRGGAKAGEYESEASAYLVEMADRYPGELSILATGSLTNVYGAYCLDHHFFEKVKEIVLMGGITSPLVFEKKVMDELNFSCDPQASFGVLTKGRNVSVITGNNCLKVLFTKEEYKRELSARDRRIAKYILEGTDYYFGYNSGDYGIDGFYNWDVTAAVYLMHPELFTDRRKRFDFSQEDLKTGFLRESTEGQWMCNLPEIGDETPFKQNIYDTWMNVEPGGCMRCKICTKNCSFLEKYDLCIADTEKLRELAYHCFLCGRCTEVCPQGIDGRSEILKLRRESVENAGGKVTEPGYEMLIKEKADYIFRNYSHAGGRSALFPGCSFPSYYPKTTRKLVELMQEKAGIGVVYDCCGKPIAELGMAEQEEQIIKGINERLREQGIEEVIMLCPNCYAFLENRLSVRVVSIYEKLRELGIGNEILKDIKIFLPCPDRAEKRWLDWMDPFLKGEVETINQIECCGLGGCARAKEPEIARKFADILKDTGNGELYTYCASCSGNLARNECHNAKHILVELLRSEEAPDTKNGIENRKRAGELLDVIDKANK